MKLPNMNRVPTAAACLGNAVNTDAACGSSSCLNSKAGYFL
jgi:hypothetical protein